MSTGDQLQYLKTYIIIVLQINCTFILISIFIIYCKLDFHTVTAVGRLIQK